MAVSHKTNNLINCSRCHLPFNFKNAVPKILPCKHWYCLNCLENLLHKTKDTQQIFCIQCQKSIDLQGLQQQQQQQNNMENIQNYYKLKPHLLNNNQNDNNNTITTTTSFGCDEEYGLKDFETDNNVNKTRSASLASDNSIVSSLYFNNDMEGGNLNLMGTSATAGGKGGSVVGLEKMSPGENCFIHGMPNTLWCNTCMIVLCRGCDSGSDHKDHKIKNHVEAKEYYQQHIKQEFTQIQETLGAMENLKMLQKDFLLKILETCCALKLQIENELVATTNTVDTDEMKESMKSLQLCLDLLGKQAPNDILKFYEVIKDENTKFKSKHKQMLQQYKMQQLLTKSAKIIDFDIIKQIFKKFENQEFTNNLNEDVFSELPNRENNSMMILTNYCIYRLYCSYIKQQQQFIEEQFMRYQQYHHEQKQNLVKQFKMLQQHQHQQQHTATATYQTHHSNNNNLQNTTGGAGTNNTDLRRDHSNYYNGHSNNNKNKPKTYAEIATTESSTTQFHDNTNATNTLDLGSTNFQPYKKPSAKPYEESRKTVNILFNPISNDNNQIYYFDFERNSQLVGRILIKVFSDLAPKMSYNFHALATHEKGFGYSGCKVFECHPNESIITGDIEQNTGYSSRSIYEDVQFVPDDTNIAPFAGAVGMRRAKKKFDSQGLVGSQFRIILTELGFTAIFGCVIEGLDVVKKISQAIVQNDKMHCNGGGGGSNNGTVTPGSATSVGGIFIAQCGLYEFVKRDILGGM